MKSCFRATLLAQYIDYATFLMSHYYELKSSLGIHCREVPLLYELWTSTLIAPAKITIDKRPKFQ